MHTNKKNRRFEHPLAHVVQVIHKPREYVDHSYNDFSCVPAEPDDTFPSQIDEMTFAQKVHHMLSQVKYQRWISWLPHGRAFKVHVPAVFEKEALPKYFGHKRYSSFLRQLNNHGFKHIVKGSERNSYYHECMLRGMPHLCKYMPQPRDARRLIPDPENEPDFDQISATFPLPDVRPAAAAALAMSAVHHLNLLQQQQQEGAASTLPLPTTRSVSDVAWLMDQLPATKRARTADHTPGVPPLSTASTFSAPSQPVNLSDLLAPSMVSQQPSLMDNRHALLASLLAVTSSQQQSASTTTLTASPPPQGMMEAIAALLQTQFQP